MGEDQNGAEEDQHLFAGTQGERIPAAQVYEFLATMAHELRNPMTPILGQVQLLRSLACREGPLPDKMHRGLERLELAVEVFMRRATMLLEISRIASGRLELCPSLINLSALTAETVERYAPLAEMARTSITLDAPPSVKGVWDRVALEQILDNLISNALMYADEKPITVAIAFEDEVVRLEVRDRASASRRKRSDQSSIVSTKEKALEAAAALGSDCGLYAVSAKRWGFSERGKRPWQRIDFYSLVTRFILEPHMSMTCPPARLERIPSAIAGLDVILQGGLMKGGVHLLWGVPGVGKTVLLSCW